jgi:hypothetical protein
MIQEGSCAIVSRAGTGKTNMIMIAAKFYLDQGIDFAVVTWNEYLHY